MPIYEYQCKSCGCVSELIQKMSDPPLEHCPECGGAVGKLMSMNTFHLKGSGWYVTDYAKKNGPSASSSASSPSSTGTTSSTSPSGDSGTKTEKAEKKASPPKTDS